MRRAHVAALTAVLLLSSPVAAAVRYEFRQVAKSDVRRSPSDQVRGESWIDGDRLRIDYKGPSIYGDNATVLIDDGRIRILDRQAQTFTEFRLDSFVQSLRNLPLSVSNVKTSLERLPGSPSIAGFPTEHWRLTTSYRMTVNMGQLTLEQDVDTVVEKWTTTAFGALADPFISSMPKTGNDQLDQLIETETTRIQGFPLRQTVSLSTRDAKSTSRARKSKLDLTAPRRQSTEILISKIEFAEPAAGTFEMPSGFRRVEPQTDRTAVTELSMSP